MQIAGSVCSICKRNVVLAAEGKFCPSCGIVVHRDCEPGDACVVCAGPFQEHERPSIDPTQDAILPRALRAGSGGPGFAILFGAVLVALAIILYSCKYLFEHASGL